MLHPGYHSDGIVPESHRLPFSSGKRPNLFSAAKGRLCELSVIIAQFIRSVNKGIVGLSAFLIENVKTWEAPHGGG